MNSTPTNLSNIFEHEAQCSDDEQSFVCSVHSSDVDFIVDDDHTPTVYDDSEIDDDAITIPEVCVPNGLAAWFYLHQPEDYHEFFVERDHVPTFDSIRSARIEFDWTPFNNLFVRFSIRKLRNSGHFETDIGCDTAWCDKIEYHANFDGMNYSEVRQFFSEIVKLNGKVVYYQFGNFSENKPEEQIIVPDDILQILPEGITNDDINEIAQVYDELGGNATPVTPSPRTVMDVYTQDHDIHPVVDLTRNVIDLTNDD